MLLLLRFSAKPRTAWYTFLVIHAILDLGLKFCLLSQAKFEKFMSSERRIVRETSLFNQQVVYKVYLDENLLLSIVVDLDSMQFSCPQYDCDLNVLSQESTILVKLCSLFKDELIELGVE